MGEPTGPLASISPQQCIYKLIGFEHGEVIGGFASAGK